MSLHRASTGAVVHVGHVLGRGGEGAVHVVNGTPKLVAKLYHKPPDAAKAEKLRLMTRSHSPGLLGVAAWPVDLLTDERGQVRGFLMQKISARQDAHRLYSPKSRRRTFPGADFRFVVRAATNVARAFAQIHAAGHVIGDVNHGNALIGKDGTAVLIDCDSIQVHERSRTFACDVGTPLFTPPELQGKAFRGLKRDQAHDRFGLAVLLFHLLFQGRHPFAGVFAEGEMPLERAIAESRFAYGAKAESDGMTAPPGTLPLDTFGPDIAALFERAFAFPGTAERPSAVEWIEPLQKLESKLAACNLRPRHFHPRDKECCWCDIEERTGARLFDDTQTNSADVDAMTAEQLWNAIEGVEAPPPLETPEFAVKQEAALVGTNLFGRIRDGMFGGVLPILVGGGVAVALLGNSSASGSLVFLGLLTSGAVLMSLANSSGRHSRLRRAMRIEWESAISQWRAKGTAGPFSRARSKLEESRRTFISLGEQRKKELEKLTQRFLGRQREDFLDTFDISKAPLHEVTRAQVDKLWSRGIRSAGDLRRHRRKLPSLIPHAAIDELHTWASHCEQTFRFDTNEPTFTAHAAKIEDKYQKERQAVLQQLRRGPAVLAEKREDVAMARARADEALREAQEKLNRPRETKRETQDE
ncbi:MAG TPA: hypothetical protein VIV63_03915 [Steroidobacteraceae bacterium]